MRDKRLSPGAGAAAWMLCALALAVPGLARADDAALVARGKVLFTTVTPACAVCHTLQAAGSAGQVGPVLDELKPDAARVLRALHSGLGVMPCPIPREGHPWRGNPSVHFLGVRHRKHHAQCECLAIR